MDLSGLGGSGWDLSGIDPDHSSMDPPGPGGSGLDLFGPDPDYSSPNLSGWNRFAQSMVCPHLIQYPNDRWATHHHHINMVQGVPYDFLVHRPD